MLANTKPIYTGIPQFNWGATDGNAGAAGPLKTANTAKDGTGVVLTVFTATAAGGYVKNLRVRTAGTNVASVLRIFANNGGVNSTLANNCLIAEVTLPATTLSEVAAQPDIIVALNLALPPTYKINVALGTTIAAGVFVSVDGGDYTPST